VAATNRDLEGMMAEKQFRSDLYYRLNVFPIHVPPLRERSEDIPLLVRHFVQQFARRMDKTIERIPARIIDALTRYAWPGNVRELQNVTERAVILSSGPVLQIPLRDLSIRAIPGRRPCHRFHRGLRAGQDGGKDQTLAHVERAHVLAILKEANWVLSGPKGAATRLGINRSTLQFRMKKLGIVRPSTVDGSFDWQPRVPVANTLPAATNTVSTVDSIDGPTSPFSFALSDLSN
jgi:formate hydrogenlyase transcriptional activator